MKGKKHTLNNYSVWGSWSGNAWSNPVTCCFIFCLRRIKTSGKRERNKTKTKNKENEPILKKKTKKNGDLHTSPTLVVPNKVLEVFSHFFSFFLSFFLFFFSFSHLHFFFRSFSFLEFVCVCILYVCVRACVSGPVST